MSYQVSAVRYQQSAKSNLFLITNMKSEWRHLHKCKSFENFLIVHG